MPTLYRWIGRSFITLMCFSSAANAVLIERVGGFYDDVTNLTWLTDANYMEISGADADGLMLWSDANAWAINLSIDFYDYTLDDFAGGDVAVNQWRLPELVNIDGAYVTELALLDTSRVNGLHLGQYWTSTVFWNNWVWVFDFADRTQTTGLWGQDYEAPVSLYALVVADDDVLPVIEPYIAPTDPDLVLAPPEQTLSAVPIPAAVWLFATGLLGLIAVARRRH